jgi:threonine/homoserine/homoserine lactone efflux protein
MTGQLIPFILVSLAVILIPGPDLVLLFRNAINGGRVAATYTAAGIMLGNAVLAAAAAAGITALLLTSQTVFTVLRLAGGLYLMYLGVRALTTYYKLRGAPSTNDADASQSLITPRPAPHRAANFRQGLLSNLLNPKVAAFYLSLFPQFDLSPWPPLLQHAFLAALFWGLALAWYTFVIFFLSRLRTLLSSPTFTRRTEGAAGIALLGLGSFLVAETVRAANAD